jgi:hypothetical protein
VDGEAVLPSHDIEVFGFSFELTWRSPLEARRPALSGTSWAPQSYEEEKVETCNASSEDGVSMGLSSVDDSGSRPCHQWYCDH